MKCMAAVFVSLLALAGCSGWTIIISPSGIPNSSSDHRASPTTPPPLRTISAGETAEGRLSSSHPADEFDLALTADGTLVIHLRWVSQSSTILLLKVGDREFRSRPPDGSPVVARVPATKGQYRLRVAVEQLGGIPDHLYRLTTGVE